MSDESAVDPVLRCDSCQELVRLETIHQLGTCHKCGNKRMRSLTILSSDEKRKLQDWGFDELVALFEPVEVKV